MKTAIRTYWPTLLVAMVILYLSLASGSGLPKTHFHFPHADKVVHLLMYFALSGIMTIDLRRAGKPLRQAWLPALLIPIVYGGLIELIQPYFPPRSCELADWLSDAIGALLGTLLSNYLWTKKHCSTK